jgi:farnesyl-diphosphate farnesyltransferase
MPDAHEGSLLKGVSRSFYLSLRLLPRPMRGAASLGYLLARASDTLADSSSQPVELRLALLDDFARAVAGDAAMPRWPAAMLNGLADPRERALLEACAGIGAALEHLPDGEARLVREVLATIIGGQRLDLERFGHADAAHPVALADAAALEDYTWRVAGCVGAFWTKLGFLTLGGRFSRADEPGLVQRGIAYGMGLQLVNILRDLPADLAAGRCYLPLADPADRAALMAAREAWLPRADEWLGQGIDYARALRQRRLRAASGLPALLGRETLALLHGPAAMQTRVKVPRRRVWLAMARALVA